MFDTHCHLNFKAFKNSYDQVIKDAYKIGVKNIIIPGTDIETSKKAIEIAEKYDGVYAAIGIHPHHAGEFRIQNLEFRIQKQKIYVGAGRDLPNNGIKRDSPEFVVGADFMSARLQEIEALLIHPKIVAIGEIGLDKHQYSMTKYQQYVVDDQFIEAQKELLIGQIKLAIKYKKSLILHNRKAKKEMLEILSANWDKRLEGKTVFHCCEPDIELLDFAIKHHIFIGADGDITYNQKKQEFIKKVPLDLLVLETDSPYLLPVPLRSKKLYPNKPENIVLVAEFIAQLKNQPVDLIKEKTFINSKRLFSLMV